MESGTLARVRGATWMARVIAVYAIARLVAFSFSEPTRRPDSEFYLHVADRSVLGLGFWGGARPWGPGLLWKLAPGSSDASAVWAQVLVSILAWSVLAVVVARRVRTREARVTAVAAVLLLSCTFPVLQWDAFLVSESLAMSLMVLLVAAGICFLDDPTWKRALVVLAVVAWWSGTRDTHAALLVCLAALTAVWAWRRGRRSGRSGRSERLVGVGLSFGLVVVALLATASASTEEATLRRWQRPVLHVIGLRVIPDPEARAFFVEHGMPMSDAVEAERFRLAGFTGPGAPTPSPDVARFLAWVETDGRRTLGLYVATHPDEAIAQVWSEREDVVAPIDDRFNDAGQVALVPPPVQHLVYPPTFTLLALALAVTAGLTTALRRHVPVPVVGATVALALLQVPNVVLAVNGDTFDTPRHSVQAAVALRLVVVLLGIAVVDAVSARRSVGDAVSARRSVGDAVLGEGVEVGEGAVDHADPDPVELLAGEHRRSVDDGEG